MLTFQESRTRQVDTSGLNVIKKQLTDLASENYSFPSDEEQLFHVFRDYDFLNNRDLDPYELELQKQLDDSQQITSAQNAEQTNPVIK